ncbi:aldo/keto reductase [Heliobacterium undosum]|uniref:Aldo/keto reductase n=1 Tax=Heliomicrobium undosum TaxID=121734 RepID=A0A845L323_9FIRM|nr:aldo/keto reductase [Heliomicrobium undosum]MZP30096.1 aldo/keto reductase [Heliomicrobium undosum]
MNLRRLGKTGLTVSELGFGAIPIIRLDTAEAIKVLRRAYERGITFYDTANAYRDSEDKIGQAFQGMRDKVVIATKTGLRDGKGALAHLENSLRMLRTDYIDLYQLHQVSQDRDWEALTAPGGAMEVLVKAQEQGKIRHIGVTSHNRQMALKLVRTGHFSTIQFPFNFIEDAAKDDLFPAARALDLGILAMKPFAGGMIDNAALAFKFLRQHPDVLAIPGYDSVQSVDQIVSFYDSPNMVTDDDLVAMDRYRQELGMQFCRRCEYCQPCPHGVMITPAMGYQVLAKRMDPPVAVEFLRRPMETVPNCVACGACVKKCPYDLPIPEMLKKHYDMWERHRIETGR